LPACDFLARFGNQLPQGSPPFGAIHQGIPFLVVEAVEDQLSNGVLLFLRQLFYQGDSGL
jgi:hypothetical protein